MAIQTRTVTATFSETNGDAIENVRVVVQLRGLGNSPNGAVAAQPIEKFTDASGQCTFELWENRQDYSDTYYEVSSFHPEGGSIHRRETFRVYDSDANLAELIAGGLVAIDPTQALADQIASDRAAAAGYASDAEGHAGDAEAAQAAAEAARDLALSYRDTAETHKDDAEAAASFASSSEIVIQGLVTDAQTAATLAEGHRDDASDFADAAAASAASVNNLHNGSGAPTSGLGDDGDYYIDNAASTIYGPKTAGAWGSPVSLVGPQGPTGEVDLTLPVSTNNGYLVIWSGVDGDEVGELDPSTFATAAQGALADSAVQPGDLAAVATSGDFADLSNRPALVTPLSSIHDFYGIRNQAVSFVDGQQFDVTGWHLNSDVGGGVFVWDSTRPKSDHNGGSVFSLTVPSPDLQTGTLEEQVEAYIDGTGEEDPGGTGCLVAVSSGPVSVHRFGARTSFSDNKPSIQAAIDYVGSVGGGRVLIPAGVFNLARGISLKDNTILKGDGPASALRKNANIDLISTAGSIETSEANTLASNANDGDLTVTLSAGKGANFSAGNWALILSSAAAPSPETAQQRGEIVRVKSVATDTLTLDGPLNFIYNTADAAEVQRITMVSNPGLENLTLINPDPTNQAGAMSEYGFCYKPTIKNVHVDTNKGSTFMFQGCVSAQVEECSGVDLKSQTTTPSGFGYFVVEAGPNLGLLMSGCRVERARHAYTTVDGKEVAGVIVGNGVPIGSRISGCSHIFPRAAGFDTHPEGLGITFSNCHVFSSEREGFQARAVDVEFVGCQVHGATAEGFAFYKSIRASARNCTAYRTNKGIDPETSGDAREEGAFKDSGTDTVLSNCRAIEPGGHGFEFVDALTGLRPTYSDCHAILVGRSNTTSRGFISRSTQNTRVVMKDCTAYDNPASPKMVRGFDAVSATPAHWADGCYSEGHTGDAFSGMWTISGSLNNGLLGGGQFSTATLSANTLDLDEHLATTYKVNGEGAAADDLSTISGGAEGNRIILFKGDANITIKHSVGNIFVEGGADFVLGNSFDFAELIRRGSSWIAIPHDI